MSSAQCIEVTEIVESPVTVNAIHIAVEQIREEAAQTDVSYDRAAATLVIRQLLLEQLDAEALLRDGEEAAVQALLQRQLQLPEADEQACQRYYRQNPAAFRSPAIFFASHILLAAPPDELEQREQCRVLAQALIDQLRAQPQDFAALAEHYSACPSKKTGGNLGQISRGSTVAEFERQLFALDEGLHGQALESRYGFHVVRIDKKIAGEQLPYAQVADSIAQQLYRRCQHQALNQYLSSLIDQADIRGVDIDTLRRHH